MLHHKLEKKETQFDEIEKIQEFPSKINYNNYTLQYLYNKTTNENIEKQGILLRSWNPITKNGERYVFNKEDGEGDLNTKSIYLPDAKTIMEISNTDKNEEILKFAKEIIDICPHKDIEIKYIE